LIGPGGAGKTTVGARLAERLDAPFADLDKCFGLRAGGISKYINRFGYGAYARENVETYRWLLHQRNGLAVVALSSGFMTYARNVHPEYARLRRIIEDSPTTFVLLPSLDRDLSVAETVRRQMDRPFARSTEREAAVIRERFPIYSGLRPQKIETMRPPSLIVNDLVTAIRASEL
jgi:shikimate kinase